VDIVSKAKLVGFVMETTTNDRVHHYHPVQLARPPLPAKPKVTTKAEVRDSAHGAKEGRSEKCMMRH